MKKKLPLIIFIIFCVVLSLSYGIGSYFVNYALAPHITNEEVQEKINESELNQEELMIYKNSLKEKQKGLEFQKKTKPMNVSSFDHILLQSQYYQNKDVHNWVIVIHGYQSQNTEMMSYGARYAEAGWNVLLPDNRAHGKSQGDYIGMGWLDKEDIASWVRWIVKRDSQAQIVLHGVSMGGATAMMCSGDQLEHVIGYIEDCGYTSVWDIFASELKNQFSLPTFPILDISNIVAEMKAGYNFKDASSIEQVKKSKQPILFIHGGQDDFVPTEMVYKCYDAATCEKDLFVVDKAGHAEARNYNPKNYWNKVFSFINEKMLTN